MLQGRGCSFSYVQSVLLGVGVFCVVLSLVLGVRGRLDFFGLVWFVGIRQVRVERLLVQYFYCLFIGVGQRCLSRLRCGQRWVGYLFRNYIVTVFFLGSCFDFEGIGFLGWFLRQFFRQDFGGYLVQFIRQTRFFLFFWLRYCRVFSLSGVGQEGRFFGIYMGFYSLWISFLLLVCFVYQCLEEGSVQFGIELVFWDQLRKGLLGVNVQRNVVKRFLFFFYGV